MHEQTLSVVWAALAGTAPEDGHSAQLLQAAQRMLHLPPHRPGPAPLRPVFTHLDGGQPGFVVPAGAGFHMPEPEAQASPAEHYAAPLREFAWQAAALPMEPAQLDVLLDLLERAAGNAACSPDEALCDIPLYDLRRLHAACAACLAAYVQEDAARGALLQPQNAEALCGAPALMLYSADISGIQKFIYTVSTERAMRMLRGRSFFLELLMEHYVERLLAGCGVSRANMLYVGGGHCYLLLPATGAARQCAVGWNRRVNLFLQQAFGAQLFVAHGFCVCSADDLNDLPAGAGRYQKMFSELSSELAAHKLHRYDAGTLREMNLRETPDASGRECRVCGRSDHLVREDLCFWCSRFEEDAIRKCAHCAVVPADGMQQNLLLPGPEGDCAVRFFPSDEALEDALRAGLQPLHIYHKKQPRTVFPNGTRLYVASYAAGGTTDEQAGRAQGIARMAVCRMDVDNLGQAFVAGFARRNAGAGAQFVSLLRTAAFSRGMNLFFKGALDGMLEREKLAVTLVYSGGDDVFLTGAWNDAIRAAAVIRAALRRYTCGALTISGGIGVFNPHFPIRTAAQHSAELEDEAKKLTGDDSATSNGPKAYGADGRGAQREKNGIALFGSGMGQAYHWNVFLNEVMGEKLAALQGFFGEADNGRGNSLLYKLLELLRAKNRMQLARYAYLLARLEPPRSSPVYNTYKAFSQSMYRWALNERDRAQLITAIYLYVYLNRKKEG